MPKFRPGAFSDLLFNIKYQKVGVKMFSGNFLFQFPIIKKKTTGGGYKGCTFKTCRSGIIFKIEIRNYILTGTAVRRWRDFFRECHAYFACDTADFVVY